MRKISAYILSLALVFIVTGLGFTNCTAQAASTTIVRPNDTIIELQDPVVKDDLTIVKPGLIDPSKIPVITLKDVYLNYPRGGQSFQLNQTIVIKFTVQNTGSYTVYESSNAGNSWTAVNNGTVAADSTAYVPYTTHKSGNLRFKVVSAADASKTDAGTDCSISAASFDGSLKATAGYNTVKLSWRALACVQAEISTYDVYRNTSPTFSSANLLTKVILPNTFPDGGEVSYNDNDVVNGTKYYYMIAPIIGGHANDDLFNTVNATPHGTIELVIGSPYMNVNGQKQEIDPGKGTTPVIVDSRTYLPIRAIVIAMGGTVDWDAATKKIIIHYKNKEIILKIKSKEAVVNGQTVTMDVAPFISNTGSTMVPVRAVSEFLGCTVNWDQAKQMVTIIY